MRLITTPAAALSLAAVFALGACGNGTIVPADGAPPPAGVPRPGPTPGPSSAVPAAAGGWERLEESPLSRRRSAVTAWTGTEVLVVGGDTGSICAVPAGAAADCGAPARPVRDGAAFDPAARAWRRIADLPVDPSQHPAAAFVAGELYTTTPRGLYSYAPGPDEWTRRGALPAGTRPDRLAPADATRLVLSEIGERADGSAAQDRLFDPRSQRWADIPKDPIGPAYDRYYTATPAGLVLTAQALVEAPGSADPSLVQAAILDLASMTWRRLPSSDMIGNGEWTWTGARVIDVSLGGADGGRVNGYGRTIPYGGALDPAASRWSRLPEPRERNKDGWQAQALGRRFSATGGRVYDDRARAWTDLPVPDGALAYPGPAVWAGDVLVVLGSSAEVPYPDVDAGGDTIVRIYRPAAG